uniref:ATP-dependent DNA helicase n=1 Tax=Nicotiana sylvestris TaxID=4096 RepID=A0A1U7VA92_NICSY|nr:PREDICTED: uncharacterized protein LOC104211410 [Nicotiana sylvestris]
MAKKEMIEAVDLLLRDLMETTMLFGGKVVVFSGDFRQTLLVVRGGQREDFVRKSLLCSEIWHQLEKLQLSENMRAKANPAFCEYLMRIAQGQTLDFVGIYLREPVFSHGQLYVALSRAKGSNCVKKNQIECIMFNAEIMHFEDLFRHFHTYLVSVAQVKESNYMYGNPLNKLTWTIDRYTIVEPIEIVNPPEDPLPPPTRLNLTPFGNFEYQPEGSEFGN